MKPHLVQKTPKKSYAQAAATHTVRREEVDRRNAPHQAKPPARHQKGIITTEKATAKPRKAPSKEPGVLTQASNDLLKMSADGNLDQNEEQTKPYHAGPKTSAEWRWIFDTDFPQLDGTSPQSPSLAGEASGRELQNLSDETHRYVRSLDQSVELPNKPFQTPRRADSFSTMVVGRPRSATDPQMRIDEILASWRDEGSAQAHQNVRIGESVSRHQPAHLLARRSVTSLASASPQSSSIEVVAEAAQNPTQERAALLRGLEKPDEMYVLITLIVRLK
jgi:hypothetical protein